MNDTKTVLNDFFSLIFKCKAKVLATILFAFISSFSSVIATVELGKAIDVLVGKGQVNFDILHKILLNLSVLYLLYSLFGWLMNVLANMVAYDSAAKLRTRAFRKLYQLPISYFDRHSHGDIVSRFTNDIGNISDALSLFLVHLFSGTIVIFSSLFYMFNISVKLTFVILLVTPICFIFAYSVANRSKIAYSKQQTIAGEMSGFINEVVGNQKLVKAFGREEKILKDFENINSQLFKVSQTAQFAAFLFNPTARFVDYLSYLAVGVIGSFLVISGEISVGIVSTFLIFSAQFSKPINEMSGIYSNILTAFASYKRIYSFLLHNEQVQHMAKVTKFDHIQGQIKFDNVYFSYEKKIPLIENFNIEIEKGSLVAIVGPTGSGKTTIVNLLMRFYELDSGSICIDGININEIEISALRRSFGMVLQDSWFFSGSIAENIAYGAPNSTREQIIDAARAANAHNFIVQMPMGYDTQLSDQASSLSQGQKQLLTIARIMLTNPAMLILDEATSSIDTLTEIRVQKAFLTLMQGRTSFVIAHRLSTITSADVVLVLDGGKIVQMGTHKQLLEKDGLYNQLYTSQFA